MNVLADQPDAATLARPPPPIHLHEEDERRALTGQDEHQQSDEYHDGWSEVRLRKVPEPSEAELRITNLNARIAGLVRIRDSLVAEASERSSNDA